MAALSELDVEAKGRDVLIFSRRNAGGVRIFSERLRSLGRRPVLVSADPADINRDACDAHVIVDWDLASLDDLVDSVERAAISPSAIVNLVDSLVGWQARAARHYGIPGGEPGREILASKTAVRSALRRLGFSAIGFVGGRVDELSVHDVESFPVIVKPASDSGGSYLVRKASDVDELVSHIGDIERLCGPDFDLIVEEYIDGVEFSVDGPVLDGRFHGLFGVEKPDQDEFRHHSSGLRISPPPSEATVEAIAGLTAGVSSFCSEHALSGLWFHIEGRVRFDGTWEVVEINPRPGGGMYPSAISRSCGIDPVDFMLRAALGDVAIDSSENGDAPPDRVLGLAAFDAHRMGRVEVRASTADITKIDGVIDAYVLESFEVTSLESENFFAQALIEGEDVDELRKLQQHILSELSVEVIPNE